LLNLVRQFKSKVVLIKDGMTADVGSMLGILSMQATYNSKITLEVTGADVNDAIQRGKALLESAATAEVYNAKGAAFWRAT
jgi:phosphotransferase system HPr (HPr) family protein